MSIFRQIAWAAQILRGPSPRVQDILLAPWYFAKAFIYLVVLFSLLGGVLRLFNVLLELGNCVWYPVGLLLAMIRWMLGY